MIRARRTLAIVTLWLPVAAMLTTWMLWHARLPSDLPTHWGVSGPADATTNAVSLLVPLAIVAGAAALTGSILQLVPLRGAWTQRSIGGVAAAVAAFALALWLMCAAPTLDVADPFTVELGPWAVAAWIAPLYGAVPLWLVPKPGVRPVAVPEPAALTPLELAPGEAAAWSRSVFSPLFMVVSGAIVVLGVALYLPPILRNGLLAVGWTLLPYVAVVLLCVVFCAFRVTVDWRGLRVTSLVLGVPLRRIRAEDIADVEAAELEPMQWGGWGYRFMPGRSAIILRRGPGLVVTLRTGRQFAITLDRPEEPASILLGVAP